MQTKYYTKQQLKKAYDCGATSVISVGGGTVKFMFRNDPDTVGYLVGSDKNIRRFKSDAKGWLFVNKLKGLYI